MTLLCGGITAGLKIIKYNVREESIAHLFKFFYDVYIEVRYIADLFVRTGLA